MSGVVRRMVPAELSAVLTFRFVFLGAVLEIAPLVVLLALPNGPSTAVAGLQALPFVAVLSVSAVAFVALQLRVYRAVVGDVLSERVYVGTVLRDSTLVAPVVIACFGIPGVASLWLGIAPLEALTAVTSVAVDGLAGTDPISSVYVAALLVGSYVFPAGMGTIAEGDDLGSVVSSGGARGVLGTHVYARYWLAAVVVAVVSLFGLPVIAGLGVGPLLLVLPIPVGYLVAKVVAWDKPWTFSQLHERTENVRYFAAAFLVLPPLIMGAVLLFPGVRHVVNTLLAALYAAVASGAVSYLAAEGYVEAVDAADTASQESVDPDGPA
jgi:hypothetical protein